jgi:hypothetical protein
MRVKRDRRERISGHVPFGSDLGPDGLSADNVPEQKVIAWIRKLRAQGRSLRGIAELLSQRGIKPNRAKTAGERASWSLRRSTSADRISSLG